ncbi:hypothetical protein Tco_0758050 [Tanacetum coccineum]
MDSMNTRLNIKMLDGNVVQKHGGDRKVEVFQVSNDDTAVAQRRLKDKQPEEKTNTDCLVYTTMYEEWGRQTFGCCRDIVVEWVFWAEDTTMSTYLVNRSSSSAIGFKTHVKCIFLEYRKGIVGNNLWRLDDVTLKVLQGVEFEVEPYEDHTFEVEPHGNVDHVVGSQEVQTQDLISYHSARDSEQHSTWELVSYREDGNEAAFVVAAVEKIYVHESLTFNNTFACEVISKWKAGLKEDMDVRLDVYVISNSCRKAVTTRQATAISWLRFWGTKDLRVKAREMYLVRSSSGIKSGNTLRGVSGGWHVTDIAIVRCGYGGWVFCSWVGVDGLLGCAGSLKANMSTWRFCQQLKWGYMTCPEG